MENEPIDIEILLRINESLKVKDTRFLRKLYNIIVLRLKLMDILGIDLKPLYYIAEFIIRHVGEFYYLPENYYTIKYRKRAYVKARYIAMWLILKNTKLSYELIADLFGGMDHSSVNHAIKTVKNDRDTNKKFNLEFVSLAAKLGLKY